jgi:hypothetical protein
MKVTPRQLLALTEIWKTNGSRTCVLPEGTLLWHCGHIPSTAEVDDFEMLWTTRDALKSEDYAGVARNTDGRDLRAATRVDLLVSNDLAAADFNKASLQDFTIALCDCRHDTMKSALRAWCIEYGFEAIVSINGGIDEVAIVQPRTHLTIVTTTSL